MPSVLWCCWLGSRKGIRPVKNWVVGCWCGYLSGARCTLAYGPVDATATHSLFSVKSRLVLPFWYRLTQVVLEKRAVKRVCVCVCVLNDLAGHSPVAGLIKCNSTNICATFSTVLADTARVRSLGDSRASCVFILLWISCDKCLLLLFLCLLISCIIILPCCIAVLNILANDAKYH